MLLINAGESSLIHPVPNAAPAFREGMQKSEYEEEGYLADESNDAPGETRVVR